MPKPKPLIDLELDPSQRERLMLRIGEIRKFAPLLAKARKPAGAGEPGLSEIEAARQLLQRVRDRGGLRVDAQEEIAKALGTKPRALLSKVLADDLTQAAPAPRPPKFDPKLLQPYLRKIAAQFTELPLQSIDPGASGTDVKGKPELARVYVELDTTAQRPLGEPGKNLSEPQLAEHFRARRDGE